MSTYNPVESGSTSIYVSTRLLFPSKIVSKNAMGVTTPMKSPMKSPAGVANSPAKGFATPPRSSSNASRAGYTPSPASSFLPSSNTPASVDKIHGSDISVPVLQPTRYTQYLDGVDFDVWVLPSSWDLSDEVNSASALELEYNANNPGCGVTVPDDAEGCEWSRVKVSSSRTLDEGSVHVLVVTEIRESDDGSTALALPFSQPRLVVIRYGAETGNNPPLLTLPVNPPVPPAALSDLTTLPHLHPPSLISSLKYRFDHDLVYTLAGTGITVAINPCIHLPELYTSNVIENYNELSQLQDKKDYNESPPHVYKVGSAAMSSLKTSGVNQSVLVSGESGSGKTVSTRFLLRYFSEVTKASTSGAPSSSSSSSTTTTTTTSVQDRVVSSNPILEALGNAKTVRNHNSSRFGKFITLTFNSSGSTVDDKVLNMSHATISTYLLEKCRILTQSDNERNYHIFYMLLLNKNRYPALFPNSLSSDCFNILADDTLPEGNEFNDIDDLLGALKIMGFSEAEVSGVVHAVATVLFLGNLEFEESEVEDTVRVKENELSKHVCAMLGVAQASLTKALTTRIIKTGSETYTKPLTVAQSLKARDALVKGLYAGVFLDVVNRVNGFINFGADGSDKSAKKTKDDNGEISILDIFGFETFATNSLEQLCINYCNEVLQSQFNSFVFKNEQSIYTEEGIIWTNITWSDNHDAIDLISGKNGVLDILDEQVLLNKTDDRVYVSLIYEKSLANHPNVFAATNKNKANGEFMVNHYAGWVTYNSTDFLEKNKDELPRETAELLSNSTVDVIKVVGSRIGTYQIDKKSAKVSSIKNVSTTSQFTTQLRELVIRIDKTQPHYIRCLKPNDALVPNDFSNAMIGDQLRCGGVLEAVRVSRLGYPHRYDHADFYKRYSLCASLSSKGSKKKKELCFSVVQSVMDNGIIKRVPVHKDADPSEVDESTLELSSICALFGIQVGKTKVFLQRSTFEDLEQERMKQLGMSATKLQKVYRGHVVLKSYRNLVFVLLKVQCRFRVYLARARTQLLRQTRASTRVQTAYRKYARRKAFVTQRFVVCFVQRVLRGRRGRLVYLSLLHTSKAIALQSAFRQYSLRKRFGNIVSSVLIVQCAFRCRSSRTIVRQLRADAKNFAKVAEERNKLKDERDKMREELEEAKRALKLEREQAENAVKAAADDMKRQMHEDRDSYSALTKGRSPDATAYLPGQNSPMSPAVAVASEAEIARLVAEQVAEKDRELRELKAEMERLRSASKSPRSASPRDNGPSDSSPSAFTSVSTIDDVAELRRKNEELERAMQAMSAGVLPLPPQIDHRNSAAPQPVLERTSSALVREQLSKYFNPSLFTSGQSPLHVAVAASDDTAIQLMLSGQVPAKLLNSAPSPIDINDTNRDGRTVLHLATMNHNASLVKMLIANNAVVNAQDRSGDTALHLSHDSALAKILLGSSANPNIPNVHGFLPLHDVVKRQDLESAKLLLAAGADVNSACDLHWCTPLHFCARTGQLSMLKLLCQREFSQSFDVSSPESSPSMSAAEKTEVKTATSHADLNAKDREGNTPLHHLVSTCHNDVVDLLWLMLQNGADPNVQNGRGLSPLHLLCQNTQARRKPQGCEMLRLLLEHAGDPGIKGIDGCTPIHLALYHKDHEDQEFATLLMSAGASLTASWRFPRRWTKWWDKNSNRGVPEGNASGVDFVLPLDIIADDTKVLHKLFGAIVRPQGWVPNDRNSCMQCNAPFGVMQRRHHCRHCGRICCGACSPGKLGHEHFPPMFADSMDQGIAARVCYVCEDILVVRRGSNRRVEEIRRVVGGSDSTMETYVGRGSGFEEDGFYGAAGRAAAGGEGVNVGIIFDSSPRSPRRGGGKEGGKGAASASMSK
jgi:myosin-5